jgi:hypothetical protein
MTTKEIIPSHAKKELIPARLLDGKHKAIPTPEVGTG